jgi:uncharacterized protein YjeT (DUF2065 family)
MLLGIPSRRECAASQGTARVARIAGQMWHEFLVAIALLFILEGIMPFLSPEGLRRTLAMISQLSDNTLRFAGLSAMVIGCLLLYAVNS